MGGSYKQCTACGKRALVIATRCPGCGRELSGPAVPEPRAGPNRRPLVIVLALLGVFGLSRLGGPDRGQDELSGFAPAESLADSAEVAATMAATARPESAAAAGVLLVARDWTNVRKARSTRAPLEAMLMPGDSVVADSLERDWYRVALYGEVLGYVHRSTLAAPK
jgi:hypothetical protein